jgi:hypothetical protein
MKTYPQFSSDRRRKFAFEITKAYIARAAIAGLLCEVEHVSDVERRKIFSGAADVHLSFRYKGQPYIVWEPCGDSSRYWIGPGPETERDTDITPIETVFRGYRPPFHRAILGNIPGLRFPVRLLGRRPG